MKRSMVPPAAAGALILAMTLASCSGSPTTEPGPAGGGYVSGGTFVQATGSQAGSLNPFTASAPNERELIAYAYEALVYVTPEGEAVPWLAESWEESSTQVTFVLREGITCSDGTPFDASVAAANVNYNADPANATLAFGFQVKEGTTAQADGNTLTVSVPSGDPFLMWNIGLLEMVCQAGVDAPQSLEEATNGTGLFVLDEVRAGSYFFQKRDGYTWGPRDVTSDTVGLPDTVEVRVIPDESTSANLLTSGEVNGGVVQGADRARLDAAGLDFVGVRNPVGEMLFNEREDRPTADPRVREALVRAIDTEAAGQVLADGAPLESIGLVTESPLLCVADPPLWTLPAHDVAASAALLDEAGWTLGPDGMRSRDGTPLSVVFLYDAATATHAPAAELVAEMWLDVGIATELRANDGAAWSDLLYTTFDWDTGWIQISTGGPVTQQLFYGGDTPTDGGLNFMFVDNADYDELARQATAASPAESCGYWQQAEAALIDRVDVFPMADNIRPTYRSGAVFEQPRYIAPTSIRMTG